MERPLLLALALVLFSGCAGRREDPDTAFAQRIPRECAAISTCSALERELLDRVNDCKTTGDLCRAASSNLDNARERVRSLEQSAAEAEAARVAAAATQVAPAQPASAVEREPQEPDAPSKYSHDAMLEQMSARGPVEREKTMRECFTNRGFKRRKDLLDLAIEASATAAEAEKLKRMGEKAAAAQ